MSRDGTIASGCFNVKFDGLAAARKSDLTAHGGLIVSGCPTVVIGGKALVAARFTDFFTCPASDWAPHLAGSIIGPCSTTVLIGGLPAARMGDLTMCSGVALAGGMGGGLGGDLGGGNDDYETECAKLWAKYKSEAETLLAPGDHDHRQRNKIISGAYADFFLRNPEFQWAGLAAYASKQVGCAMDHSQTMSRIGGGRGTGGAGAAVKGMADYTYEMLGKGNRDLFVDIYPMHRFFEEQGMDKMQSCANARTPPMTAPALDGFKAIQQARQTGDKKRLEASTASFAAHEQVNILQTVIYNDFKMRRILDANETGMPGTMPADVVMASGCSDPTGGKQTHKFANGTRSDLYNVPERMDWILNDIGKDYFGFAGSPRHMKDLDDIKGQGATAGAAYPAPGVRKP